MAMTQEALSTERLASSTKECRSSERVVGGEGRNRSLNLLNPSHLGPNRQTNQAYSATTRTHAPTDLNSLGVRFGVHPAP